MEPFKTSDQDIAAYLMVKGMKLLDSIPTDNPKRQEFLFLDQEDRDQLVQQFLSGNDQISASAYARARRAVRRYLK